MYLFFLRRDLLAEFGGFRVEQDFIQDFCWVGGEGGTVL